MAGTITRSPWLGCFTLTDSNAHQLSALLQDPNYVAIASQPIFQTKARCQYLLIGNDISNGGAKLYVGNENVSTTFFGARLVASGFVPYYSTDANLIDMGSIWLIADTNPTIVTVNFLTR